MLEMSLTIQKDANVSWVKENVLENKGTTICEVPNSGNFIWVN
jgi:hypothetical protein